MESFTTKIPTFHGHERSLRCRDNEEFAAPYVPVLVYKAEGLRIVLGSSNLENAEAPDIHIERRPCGWAIFLHPLGEGDPSGFVYFLDNGRSYVVSEKGGATEPIEIRKSLHDFPELDNPSTE